MEEINPIGFYGSICLSDIPKDCIQTGKNGKLYLNVSIMARREVSQWGHTHNIIVDIPKEKRVQGQKPIYIGNLKPSTRQASTSQQTTTTPSQTASVESLPF